LWGKEQLNEALRNIRQFVIVITDPLQQIAFTGPGFEEMTGYSAVEAYGRNPKFLQGPSTNKKNTQTIKLQLTNNNASETVLENYRKDGQLYLCKIIIKPVVNIRKQLVNYIAYEQEIAA
jgi:PAS domain S-box-containing protein